MWSLLKPAGASAAHASELGDALASMNLPLGCRLLGAYLCAYLSPAYPRWPRRSPARLPLDGLEPPLETMRLETGAAAFAQGVAPMKPRQVAP